MNSWALLIVTFICLAANISIARPEYALRTNLVNCASCHYSPGGGGIRNQTGKLFGNHGYQSSELSEKMNWFQFDFRTEAIKSQSANARRGLMVMTATPSVAIPLEPKYLSSDLSKNWGRTTLVASYGLGRLDTGLGEAYVLKDIGPDPFSSSWLNGVSFGRFIPPFGLLTDEHRTYTRMSTLSTSRDLESGVWVFGTPKYWLHWDLALTSGLQGDAPAADDAPWAVFFNVRSMPFQGPVLFGASFSRHDSLKLAVKPEALGVYTLIDFVKIKSWLPLQLTVDYVSAVGWNNSTINTGATGGIGYFIPSTEALWQKALEETRSQSYLLQANIYLNEYFSVLARKEQFIPDVKFAGDKFDRNGVGFKWQLGGHSSLQFRYDYGRSGRPGITELGSVRAIGETYFLFFHLWI